MTQKNKDELISIKKRLEEKRTSLFRTYKECCDKINEIDLVIKNAEIEN